MTQDLAENAVPGHGWGDRVILVTGAGAGIGLYVARHLASLGATLLLLGRNQRRLDAAYDAIEAAGGKEPVAIPFDLEAADDAAFDALAQTLHAQLGRLDGIFHSAAQFVPLSPLAIQTAQQWRAALNTNLVAPFALTRACLPLLTQAPDAAVLFTAEAHSLVPGAYWGGFAVSLAGLPALVRIWSEEFASTQTPRFNLLIPGAVDSPMRTRTHPGELASSRRPVDALMPLVQYWMGPASRGRSGEIVDAASSAAAS